MIYVPARMTLSDVVGGIESLAETERGEFRTGNPLFGLGGTPIGDAMIEALEAIAEDPSPGNIERAKSVAPKWLEEWNQMALRFEGLR